MQNLGEQIRCIMGDVQVANIFFHCKAWENINSNIKRFHQGWSWDYLILSLLSFRVCLHGSGGPHVGEVIHLGEIKKEPSFTCGSSRGSDGRSNRLYTGKKHQKVSLKEYHWLNPKEKKYPTWLVMLTLTPFSNSNLMILSALCFTAKCNGVRIP